MNPSQPVHAVPPAAYRRDGVYHPVVEYTACGTKMKSYMQATACLKIVTCPKCREVINKEDA